MEGVKVCKGIIFVAVHAFSLRSQAVGLKPKSRVSRFSSSDGPVDDSDVEQCGFRTRAENGVGPVSHQAQDRNYHRYYCAVLNNLVHAISGGT